MKSLRARLYTTGFSSVVLATLFAILCTAAHNAELAVPDWRARVDVPAPVTVRLPSHFFRITMLRNDYIYSVSATATCPDMISRGTVVPAGSECGGLLTAFEEGRRPIRPLSVFASFALYLFIGLMLSGYMRREGMGRARWFRSQAGLLAFMGAFAILAKGVLLFTPLPFVAIPAAAIPMLAAMFLGRRLAFGVALATSLIVSSLLSFSPGALFFFLTTGLSSVMAATHRGRVWRLVRAGLLTATVAMATSAFTTLLFNGSLDIFDDFRDHVDPRYSIWIAAFSGGLASGLLAILLLPISSAIVGEVSRNKLLDLQDLDNPLLKRLRERAPSTWEHSRAMANLAEAASHAIGANSMLVRVGAYFHDVGKSSNPEYFIENQRGPDNPHNAIAPIDSARAIFAHVVEGTRLLRMAGIPEDIIEFAYTHHGTSMLEYFWIKNVQAGNPGGLTEKDFSYPGHNPTTQETAILMIVDATEAAARTIDSPDRQKFEALVQRIVFAKLNQGQFDESGLTLHELRIIIATVVDTLVSMYHARIKYPWQVDEGRAADTTARVSVRAADNTAASVPTSGSTPVPIVRTPSVPPPKAPPPTRESRPPAPIPKAPFPKATDADEDLSKRSGSGREPGREEPAPFAETYTGPIPQDPRPAIKKPGS